MPTHLESETKTCEELLEEGRLKLEAIMNSTPIFEMQEPAIFQAPDPAR